MQLAPNTKPGQHRTFGEMVAEHRQMIANNREWMSTDMLTLRANNARYVLAQPTFQGKVLARIARAELIACKEELHHRDTTG